MRKINVLTAAMVLTMLMLTLASCGRSEFGVTVNTEKYMLITAENAEKDASFQVGTLEVGEGEEITITSDLKKGSVRVEIIETPEEQTADKLPETDGKVIITANLKKTDGAKGTISPGSYQLKGICLENATGTVGIEVKPAP